MEDEGTFVSHVDQLGQVLLVFSDVDHTLGVVAEESEIAINMQVDGRRLDAVLAEGVDDDPARRQLLADRAVG